MEVHGPLSRSYAGAAALVVFSLVPYLALTAGIFPLLPLIEKSTGLSTGTLDVTIAASTGAYAVGTVLAVQFAVHRRARRMLVLYEAGFVIASILAALSPTGDVFIGAFIAQGLFTSLMLIAAVPPLVVQWPAKKMPTSALIMNLCIFGAVAVGPTLGAVTLDGHTWRPLFWGVAGVAVVALLFSLLTFEDDEAQDKDAPVDTSALALAVVGCGAAFFGAGQLQATLHPGATSLGPLIGGTALLVALVIHQYGKKNPLMPVKSLATALPTTGIFVALTASAAAFGMMELILELLKKTSPATVALLFLPEFAGAVAIACLFGAIFRTRFIPILAFGGLLAITAAAALMIAEIPTTGAPVAVVTGLLGLGVGASVSPALFMAGFSLKSNRLQRVFAIIELMRGVTAFLLAPIFLFLASVLSSSPTIGVKSSMWICLAIAAGGFLGAIALYATGQRGLQVPDLEAWQEEGETAWLSPPIFGRLRRLSPDGRPPAHLRTRRAA